MPIPAIGATSFGSVIGGEIGPSSGVERSLSDYYGIPTLSGSLPASGEISFSDFRGQTYDVVDVIEASGTYTPRMPFPSTIAHIFVVGAGGSGGAADGSTALGAYRAAGATGGGAGGVVWHQMTNTPSVTFSGSYTAVIGVGGASVYAANNSAQDGNAGSLSSFSGANATLVANGGSGGNGRSSSGPVTAPSAPGGTASGGSEQNWTGGASGSATTGTSDTHVGSGGSAPTFSDENYDSDSIVYPTTTSQGATVSDKNNLPSVITDYLSNRGQSLTLADFDGTAGTSGTGPSDAAVLGAGSGGVSASGYYQPTQPSGTGGDGVVIVIYEVT